MVTGQVQCLLTSPTFTNSLRCLPFILDWLLMYGAEASDGPGVFSDDNERMRWNSLSNTGRKRADDATNMATPASAVVHVMTGMTVYEKSSKSIEFRDVSRAAEKAIVLFACQISMNTGFKAVVCSPNAGTGRAVRVGNTAYTIPMLKIADSPTL